MIEKKKRKEQITYSRESRNASVRGQGIKIADEVVRADLIEKRIV